MSSSCCYDHLRFAWLVELFFHVRVHNIEFRNAWKQMHIFGQFLTHFDRSMGTRIMAVEPYMRSYVNLPVRFWMMIGYDCKVTLNFVEVRLCLHFCLHFCVIGCVGFVISDKNEYRVCIEFCQELRHPFPQTCKKLKTVYGDEPMHRFHMVSMNLRWRDIGGKAHTFSQTKHEQKPGNNRRV